MSTAPRRQGRRTLYAAVLVAALALVTGCAGVPSSSKPDIIGPVGGSSPAVGPSISPTSGEDPHALVTGFLIANATNDRNHAAARQFLTSDARNRWSDTTAVVLASMQVSTFDSKASTVTVTGKAIGALDANGTYTPALSGDGSGGDEVSYAFGITLLPDNQWRIDQLANGLVLSLVGLDSSVSSINSAFLRNYKQWAIYFFDLTQRHLVPDPRYSALSAQGTQPIDLLDWMVASIAAGPSAALQPAVATELPSQIDPRGVSVTITDVVTVTVPGAAQLDGDTRDRLAAQIAVTIAQVEGSTPVRLVDAGRVLTIPLVKSTQFNSADFATAFNPALVASPALYYLRAGRVLDAAGAPMAGALGTGAYGLSSVALAPSTADDLLVAGVAGSGTTRRLLVGSRSQGLHQTSVSGELTRPSWVPGLDEVWVGSGNTIVRWSNDRATVVPVTATPVGEPSRVLAVRLSPEGTRVAIVLSEPNDTAQVWIGAVVRQSGQVRVDGLEPITPQAVNLVDVAWNDLTKLFVVGRTTSGQPLVSEVQVDGSQWTPKSTANLPNAPDSVTVTAQEDAWVSVLGTVWTTQQGSAWVSPDGGVSEVPGTNPVYVE